MKDLKAYHRTGEGFDALKKAMGNLRDESLKDEAVAGSLSTVSYTHLDVYKRQAMMMLGDSRMLVGRK